MLQQFARGLDSHGLLEGADLEPNIERGRLVYRESDAGQLPKLETGRGGFERVGARRNAEEQVIARVVRFRLVLDRRLQVREGQFGAAHYASRLIADYASDRGGRKLAANGCHVPSKTRQSNRGRNASPQEPHRGVR